MPVLLRISDHTKGIFLVSAAAVAWSSGGLFFRTIALDPWTTSFWRSVFAAVLFAGCALIVNRDCSSAFGTRNFRHGFPISIGIALSMSTFLPALALTSVANVALIYATAPILTAVLGYIWLRETLDGVTIACAFAVLAGGAILFLSSARGGGINGDTLALVSTGALVLVALSIRARPASALLPYICLANLLVASIAFLLAPSLAISGYEALLLLLFAFLQVTLSFTLFTLGARLLPVKETALINATEGPLSPLWVWLAFDEKPSTMTMISGAIILAAVFCHIAIGARRRDERLVSAKSGAPTERSQGAETRQTGKARVVSRGEKDI